VWWNEFEPNAPQKTGNTWIHSYNGSILTRLQGQVALARAHGLNVLIENFCGPPCMGSGWPAWLYTAAYNSHGITYTSATQANTDFWTDSLQQQFAKDFLSYLAGGLASTPGIVGYDILNEPDQGTLPDGQSTTQTMLSVE